MLICYELSQTDRCYDKIRLIVIEVRWMKYCDFLKDDDFEEMCCDIIKIRENILLESFSAGKDRGIDFRGFKNGKMLIVQAKSIKDYIISKTDLISEDDINAYLREDKYRSVKEYYKKKVIFNLVGPYDEMGSDNPFINCKWLYKDIVDLKKYYVKTRCFEMLKEHIEHNNIIILTGDPGSGKTSNAKMLISYLLSKNEIDEVIVLKSYNDFYKYYDSDKKQIFFFDDFWGSTFKLNYFDSNMERDFLLMFKLVSGNFNSYLIMTTREYVLRQGLNALHIEDVKEINSRIYHSNSNFSELEKVKILISHVFNSNLDYNVISILVDKAEEITGMINYSPNTISYYIDQHHDMEIENEYEFFYWLVKYLKNPVRYFENIFYKLSKGARVIAYIMSISNPPVYLGKLKECFILFSRKMNDKNIKIRNFNLYLEELGNIFTKYDIKDGSIDFINHSIHDFINNKFEENYLDFKDYFIHSIIYFNQFTNFLLSDEFSVDMFDAKILIKRLMDNFDNMELISIDGDELDIMDSPNEPFVWYNQKIWLSIDIAEKYHDKGFMEFLIEKTLGLIDYYYFKSWHSYEDTNFTSIPDLLKRFSDFGYDFDYKEIGVKFFGGYKYLFELDSVKYGPETFQSEIKKLFNQKKDMFISYLPSYLESELQILSQDGIGFSFELLTDEFENMCTYFGIPYSQDLAKIINDNKVQYNVNTHFNVEYETLKLSADEIEVKEYLKKVRNSLTYDEYLNKFDILLAFDTEGFKDTIISRVVHELKGDKSDSIFSDEVSLKYLKLIFNYIKDTEDVDLSWKLYSKLVKFIIDKTGIKEDILYGYAYYKYIDGHFMSSRKHLISKFKISDKDIDELIKLGVFKGIYNLVNFTDDGFENYLRVMYVVNKENKSFDDYKQYFNGDEVLLYGDYAMFEYFDTKNFNKIFLKQLFKNVINDGYDTFKGNIFDIEFYNGVDNGYSYIALSNENYVMMCDFYETIYEISIWNELIDYIKQVNLTDMNKVKISEFYDDNKDNEYGKHLDYLCTKYYNLAKEIFEKLVKCNDKAVDFSDALV